VELTVATREVGDTVVVEVGGEVDVYTAPALDETLSGLVAGGRTALVVDLTGVDFLDSTGLGVLVKALKRVRELDGRLAVVAREERIRKVFRITGLDSVMGLTDSVDTALAG
jgi:anti-sigma B factor antagonist